MKNVRFSCSTTAKKIIAPLIQKNPLGEMRFGPGVDPNPTQKSERIAWRNSARIWPWLPKNTNIIAFL